ncbi:MAG: cytochrome c [Gemmatimonadota bacterium]|nr:cytochrome c [Gemmatimonadota bacterium]
MHSRTTAALLVACLAAALSGCDREGRAAYVKAGCDECHGMDRRGVPSSGPDIRRASKHWDEESLRRYFRDPDSVANADPRLREMRDLYGEGMPPLKLADPLARDALVQYVLR